MGVHVANGGCGVGVRVGARVRVRTGVGDGSTSGVGEDEGETPESGTSPNELYASWRARGHYRIV